jgi:lipoprotein-releasing system permease protein
VKSPAWLFLVSLRWFSPRRGEGGGPSPGFAIAGIAVGVAALIVILGVMNGFQLGYIESILEVSSYHVRIDGGMGGRSREDFDRLLSSLPGVAHVLPFRESQILAQAPDGRVLAARLRGLPADADVRDPGLGRALGMTGPLFGTAKGKGIVIGSELARYLNVSEGDSVLILSVVSDPEDGLGTRSLSLPVRAIFHSGYYDFDSGLAFVEESEGLPLLSPQGDAGLSWGLKLTDRYKDSACVARLAALGIKAEGWREYNRSFFGALRTEKTMMMILVGLIFLVVGVNIHQSMKRTILERTDEIALLKSAGAGLEDIRRIFILDGLAKGALGAGLGLGLGLLVATNVNEVFALAAAVLNGLSGLLSGGRGGDFSVFPPNYFYLMEVPVRLLFPEALFVVSAAMASTALAAAVASSRVAGLDPADLLRYE